MKKIIPYWFLFICLTALAKYPSRIEIMTFFIIGSGLFLFLSLVVCIIMKDYEFSKKKYSMKNVIGFIIPLFVALYGVCFLNVFFVSLFERKIVWNIFETQWGKVNIIFDLSLLVLLLIYSGLFYLRHHRWPYIEEINRKIG